MTEQITTTLVPHPPPTRTGFQELNRKLLGGAKAGVSKGFGIFIQIYIWACIVAISPVVVVWPYRSEKGNFWPGPIGFPFWATYKLACKTKPLLQRLKLFLLGPD